MAPEEAQSNAPRRRGRPPGSKTRRRRATGGGTDLVAQLNAMVAELIKKNRQLTILITTHYMDEADRLCDRIAIVDHGKLVALDTPAALKASVPGSNVIEAQFENPPADWEQRLKQLPDVTSVQHEGAGMYRVLTGNGSATTTALVEMAVQSGVPVKTLSVQNTTLDDVFVYYTGRQLRDALQEASPLESAMMMRR